MKRLIAKSELCIGCRLCEEVCSKAYRKENNREKSAIRIDENGEKGYIIQVCNQCGTCLEICVVPAITRDKNGIVRLKRPCVGCLSCVEIVLRKLCIIMMSRQNLQVYCLRSVCQRVPVRGAGN